MPPNAAPVGFAPSGETSPANAAGPTRQPAIRWRLLVLILIIGALFRFMALGEVRHGYDEGYPAYDALRILEGRELLLSSQPSSVFLDNPPLMAYLQLLPLLLWRSVWSVYLFVTALNTLAIGIVFLTTRRLLGETAAYVAAFLLAISPWVVHFSRMPWVQGLLPLWLALIAWGLWPALVSRQGTERQLLVAMGALSAMVLSYILGIAIVAPVAVLIVIFWRQLPKRAVLAGALFLGAGLLLFSAGLLQKSTRNSERLESFVSDNEFNLNGIALEHALRLVTGLDYESQPEPAGSSPRQILSRLVSGLLLVAVLAGVGRALLALRAGGAARRLALVLLIWFLTPVLGFLFLPYLVHPHYLLLTLPAGHLLAAWGITPLLERARWRPAILTALLAGAILFGLNIYQAGQAVAARPAGPDFTGWALADAARIGRTIRTLTDGASPPRRLAAEDNAAMLSSLSAAYIDTMPELQYPHFILLPGQEPLLYALRDVRPDTLGLGLHEEWFPEQAIQTADGATVSFLRIQPYTRAEALQLPQTTVDWTSDAGLTLLGYTLATPEPFQVAGSFVITTYWRVEALHPDRGEWFVTPFVQVVDANWALLSNVTAEGQWGHRFQEGDLYVQQQTIPLPEYVEPGEHQLLIGLTNAIDGAGFNLNAPTGPVPFWQTAITVTD